MNNLIKTLTVAVALFCFSVPVYAQGEKAGSMPPAKVVVAEVKTGMIAPESEFIGTVYYQEVSDVASEVEGLVIAVNFEDGQRVDKGAMLVSLGSDLLQKSLKAARASHEQTLSDLKKARKDFRRAKDLFKEELISEQSFDESKFNLKSLENKALSLEAGVERFEAELVKKNIRSPFKGIVIKKHIDRGEWLSQGSVIATIAKDDVVDILVNAPESVIRHLEIGMEVNAVAGIERITGNIIALIPSGDLSTRTFPVKIRAKNNFSLLEGMGAKVSLPIDAKKKVFIVPRDAVMTVFGNTVVYVVNDSKAMMITVMIVGYDGMIAGIQGQGLIEGMQVVVKGNERLREGQEVTVQK